MPPGKPMSRCGVDGHDGERRSGAGGAGVVEPAPVSGAPGTRPDTVPPMPAASGAGDGRAGLLGEDVGRRRSSQIGATWAFESIRSVAGGTGNTAVAVPAAATPPGTARGPGP